MMGMGEKPRNIQKYEHENKGKNSPFGRPSIPTSTKMEADCFPVSENTENKPDLQGWDGGPSLVEQEILS